MRWVFKAGGSINSVPTIDKKRVYFGANDGILYAVNIEDGSLDWYFESDSTIQSTVTLYKDVITSYSIHYTKLYEISQQKPHRYQVTCPSPIIKVL